MTMMKSTRRAFLATATAAGLSKITSAQVAPPRDSIVRTDFSKLPPYGNGTLPAGIRSRHIANVNGMTVHILEAGFETPGRPAVLLLHGFPELAYSWRKVMPALAGAGFHVIAPDQRGYGETTGWDSRYDTALEAFRVLNLVEDAAALIRRLGLPAVHVAGHDFGSPVAACCAILQPRVFRSV